MAIKLTKFSENLANHLGGITDFEAVYNVGRLDEVLHRYAPCFVKDTSGCPARERDGWPVENSWLLVVNVELYEAQYSW